MRSAGNDWARIRRDLERGHTVRACLARYGLSAREWQAAVEKGLLPRPAATRLRPSEKRREVARLLRDRVPYSLVALELGMSKSTVAYHARRIGIPARAEFAKRVDWERVEAAHHAGMSVRECAREFGFHLGSWHKAVQRGAIRPRSHVIPLEQLLVAGRRTGRAHLKARLIKAGIKENRCEQCGIADWRGKPLSMALHHVNGDGTDNRLENLQLLCPNCHSQTDNYGGRNGHRRKRGRKAG